MARAIVVGAAILRDGELLAAQRSEPESMRGMWEFPGGKPEAGESEEQALVRECREELGCVVEPTGRLGEVEILGGAASLRVWVCALVSGEPIALEHLEVRWVALDDLHQLAWIPADLPLVEAIVGKVPRCP